LGETIVHFEPSDDEKSSGRMTWVGVAVAKPSNFPFLSGNLAMEGVLARGSERSLFHGGCSGNRARSEWRLGFPLQDFGDGTSEARSCGARLEPNKLERGLTVRRSGLPT
jgi:hypothetical protein